MATVTMQNSMTRDGKEIAIFLENQMDPAAEASLIRKALTEASKQFAEKWLEENKDKVIERLNIDALANMILLEAAKKTSDDILKKGTE